MIKKITLIIVVFLISFCAKAQSISPNVTTEFCPLVNITFTVTLPRIADNTTPTVVSFTNTPVVVSGVSNLTNTQTQTTFTFVGRFRDVNINQVFRVTYVTSTNPNGVYDAEFKKIKSLFYSTTSLANPPCNVIRPNQIQPVVFPRCQAATATISFTNIQWFTNFENPEICFGTVTDYEYQLPSGWSIAGNPSNGSNWIAGGNSVVVTSDLSTGDGVDIKIRASNKTCGTGLAANGPISTVRISRPEPSMSISPTGNQAFICANSIKTFTLNGLPANATVTSWITSDPLLATVPSPSTGISVDVTNTGGNGSVILTANISQCSYTYQKTDTINLGTNVPAVYSISSNYVSSSNNQFQYYSNPYEYGLGQVYQPKNQSVLFYTVIDNSFITNPSWSVTGTYSLFYQSPNSSSLYMTTPNTGSYTRNTATVRLLANSSCGNIDKKYIFEAIVNGYSFRMTASPNPTKGNINVSIAKVADTTNNKQVLERSLNANNTGNTKLYLYDFNTNALVKQWSYQEMDATNYRLNIVDVKSGYYILKMERDNKTTTTKIFVK